jgi:uncharacterized membrane protein YkvA (DUF1232 family)
MSSWVKPSITSGLGAGAFSAGIRRHHSARELLVNPACVAKFQHQGVAQEQRQNICQSWITVSFLSFLSFCARCSAFAGHVRSPASHPSPPDCTLDFTKAFDYFPPMSTPPNGDHDLDIAKVTQRAQDIENKLPKLTQVFEQAKIMLSMVKDYWTGAYREIPYWAISAVSMALLYVLNPADVIPDVLIGVGYLDDATVVAFCLKLVQRELERYQEWQATQAKTGKVVDV